MRHGWSCEHNRAPKLNLKTRPHGRIVKTAIQFVLLLPLLLALAGCVSSGLIRNASPITAKKPFDLDLILVKTSSSPGNLTAENQTLNDAIVSGLRDAHLFQQVGASQDDLGSGSGITVNAWIVEIRKVSKEKRLWEGAMAGRARVRIQVTVSDLNSGHQIQTFEASGQSSGGSALAGTTDEALQRAAAEIVAEILKIDAQTAE